MIDPLTYEEYKKLFGDTSFSNEQTYETVKIEPADYYAFLGRVAPFSTEKGFTGKQIDFFLLEKRPLGAAREIEKIMNVIKDENGVKTVEPIKDKFGRYILQGVIFPFRLFDVSSTATQGQKNFANFQRKELANQFGALNDNGQIVWNNIARCVGTVVTFQLAQRPNSKYLDLDINSFKVIPGDSRVSPTNVAALYKAIEQQNAVDATKGSPEPDDLPF